MIIARPTKKAIDEMSAYEEKTKRGLIDAFIDINSGECAGIFWRNDGYSWYENAPKNTYQVSIPARSELDETGEDWDAELENNIDNAIDNLKQKLEMQNMSENKKICDVCGEELIMADDFWSCPVYMAGKDKNADEHTSYPVE